METLVLPNLLDDFRYRVCGQNQYPSPGIAPSRTKDNADDGEYDQLCDHQECKIPGYNCAVQTGLRQSTLILREVAHHDG
jgi:hypothetical protein